VAVLVLNCWAGRQAGPLLLLISCPGLSSCGSGSATHIASAAPADLVLTGGKVFTADPDQPWAEALVVRDGRIVFVGGSTEALSLRRSGDSHHELDGRLVIPRLVDGHTHPGMIAFLGEDSRESPIPKTSHADIVTWLEGYTGWFWPPMIQAGNGPPPSMGSRVRERKIWTAL
jgi:hypothetical protein